MHLVRQSVTRVHKDVNLAARNLGTASPAVKCRDVSEILIPDAINPVLVPVLEKRILTFLAIRAPSLAETELVKGPSLRKCAMEGCKSTKHATIVL